MTPWRSLASFSFVACLLASGSVCPQAANSDAARLFDSALRHVDRGEYESAIEAFQRAYELEPHYSVLYNLGLAYAALGQHQQAAHTLHRYLEEGAGQISEARTAHVRRKIEQELSHLGRLVVQLGPAQSNLVLDGESVQGRTFHLTPGRHVARASLDGYHTQDVEVFIERGQSERLSIELEPIRPPKSRPVSHSEMIVYCDEPRLRVEAEGQLIGWTREGQTRHRFELPPGVRSVRLVHSDQRVQEVALPPRGNPQEVRCETVAAPPPVPSEPAEPNETALHGVVVTASGVTLGAAALTIYLVNNGRYREWRTQNERLPLEPANEPERLAIERNDGLRDSIETWDRYAQIMAISGAALVAGGIALYLVDGDDETAARTPGDLELAVGDRAVRLRGWF